MEGRYAATVGNRVEVMSMEDRNIRAHKSLFKLVLYFSASKVREGLLKWQQGLSKGRADKEGERGAASKMGHYRLWQCDRIKKWSGF